MAADEAVLGAVIGDNCELALGLAFLRAARRLAFLLFVVVIVVSMSPLVPCEQSGDLLWL